MAAPINITPATAYAITALPFSQTVTVTDAPESLTNVPSCVTRAWNAVWYTYVPDDGVTFILLTGDVGAGSDAGYFPSTSVWTGTPASLTQFAIGSNTYCLQLYGGYYFRLPVTAGTTYYFQVVHDAATTAPSPSVLAFSIQEGAVDVAPIGSIVISDDADEYPAAILDATTGDFLRYAPFPAGEFTDTLPTGEVCTQNGFAGDSIAFLDADWNVVATAALGTRFLVAVKSDRDAHFYCVTRASAARHVEKYTALGVQVYDKTLPSDFDNTTVFALARDGSRIYASLTSANQPIWVYNLGTNTQEANLAVGVVGESFTGVGDGYVARDGSLLFLKENSTDTFVVRYDQATGAILDTYDPTTITYGNRFCIYSDAVGAESLLVWGYILGDTNNNAYFEAIALATGTSVSEIGPIPVTSSSQTSTNADDPNAISNSCPVFVLTAALAAPSTPTGSYHTEALIERRVRQAPHLVSELQRQFISKFQIHLQPGIGQGTGQGADPMVMFAYSKDGGQTWSDERRLPAGKVGQFARRCIAWRLGVARDWVFRISVTDPNVPWALVAAYLDGSEGTS